MTKPETARINKEHFQYTINLIKYTIKERNFSLDTWNSSSHKCTSISQAQNPPCRTTLCIGGALALSTRYRAWANYDCAPRSLKYQDPPQVFSPDGKQVAIHYHAIALFWNTPVTVAERFCSPNNAITTYGTQTPSKRTVCNKLQEFLDNAY